MSPALTILLITLGGAPTGSGGSPDDPFTPAIARATREALGPDARVTLHRLEALPTDAEAVALGAEMHADAVVEVTWTLPDHLRATIRMERQNTGRWLGREIDFRTFDDPAERSRTVGFAIASMLPEHGNRDDAPPEAVLPVVPSNDAAQTPGATAAPPKAAVNPKGSAEAATGAVAETAAAAASESSGARSDARAPSSPEAPRQAEQSASATAVAALGVGDGGGSIGGLLDYRNMLVGPLWMRFGVSARFGVDPPAGMSARFFSGAAGLAWRGWASPNGRAELGLRLDVLVLLDQLERRSSGVTTTRNKVIPGADVLAEASLFITREAAVVLGAGAEARFGETDVFVDGRRLTTLEPVHPVVELGLRLGFQ